MERRTVLKKMEQNWGEWIHYRHPDSFTGELNLQCRLFLIPSSMLAILSWVPLIRLDRILFPGLPVLVFLRVGYMALGAGILLFMLIRLAGKPVVREKRETLYYLLLFMVLAYLEISVALFNGLTGAYPGYLSGYSISLLLLPMAPLRKGHLFSILGFSFLLFFTLGALHGMSISTPDRWYEFINFIISFAIAFLAILLFDLFRRRSYERYLFFQQFKDSQKNEIFKKCALTAREGEVVELILKRKSNREIEELLFISPHTVKNHIYNIYTKLGVRNRGEVQLLFEISQPDIFVNGVRKDSRQAV